MDRRDVITQLLCLAAVAAAPLSWANRRSGTKGNNSLTIQFDLTVPAEMTNAEFNRISLEFWDYDRLKSIEDTFRENGRILHTEHIHEGSKRTSIITFSDKKSWMEWEKEISKAQACNDDRLVEMGFVFSMQRLDA